MMGRKKNSHKSRTSKSTALQTALSSSSSSPSISSPNSLTHSEAEASTTPASTTPSSPTSINHDAAAPMKVAIIGSGPTGLSAAYFLHHQSSTPIEVHLFERSSKIGLDGNSITVDESVRIDVPMRSINKGYYPELMKLYKQLGIPLKKSNFTYSFSSAKSRTPYLIYQGSSGMKGFSFPSSMSVNIEWYSMVAEWLTRPVESTWTLVCNVANWVESFSNYLCNVLVFVLGYLHLLAVSLWYYYTGATRNPAHSIFTTTVGDYYLSGSNTLWTRCKRRFLWDVLIPLFSAMMTIQSTSVLHCPISDIFDYVALTFGQDHYVVDTGVQYVEKQLSEYLQEKNIHVNCQISKMSLCSETGKVTIQEAGGSGHTGFDHVILATQANQSAQFLDSYLDSLSDVKERTRIQKLYKGLCAFQYEDSQVINHTDESVLPSDVKDWRDLNLVSPPHHHDVNTSKSSNHSNNSLEKNTHTMASHILIHTEDQVVIQTTNPLGHLPIHASKVLSISNFERAISTIAGKQSQLNLKLQDSKGQRIWCCGSWSYGIPLLEGCVVSSQSVVDCLLSN
ncbi:unnamed protein product [Sympodiomycopsis kandeliae]